MRILLKSEPSLALPFSSLQSRSRGNTRGGDWTEGKRVGGGGAPEKSFARMRERSTYTKRCCMHAGVKICVLEGTTKTLV